MEEKIIVGEQDIKVSLIDRFPKHPYHMFDDMDMSELVSSIQAIVVDVDDNEAVIMMVDSNCQRSKILPSEKAFSYKMKLDAIKRQGKRTDLTCVQVEDKANQKPKYRFSAERLNQYLPANMNDKQAEQYVLKALYHYKKYIERKNTK